MIQPTSNKISEIFSDGVNRLVIPVYQRNFDWGRNEVQELMSDLMSSMGESDSKLFLGTIVLNDATEGELIVVDGQQRITTISIVLLACRTVAKKISEYKMESLIQQKLAFTDETTGEVIAERVTVSPSIKDVYSYICRSDWDGVFPTSIGSKQVRRQANKIKPIYDFILHEIENYDKEMLGKFLKTLYNSYVVQITIKSEIEAFDIFERTNARGLDLNVADLLKNFLFANNAEEDIQEEWKQIVDNSDNTMQRMIKYAWVSMNGSVQKKELYRALQSYGKKVGVRKLTKELYLFSRYYYAARSLDRNEVIKWLEEIDVQEIVSNEGYRNSISRVFEALRLFNVTQAYPLIYSIFVSYKNFPERGAVTKTLLRLIEAIEEYHFINNAICDRVGNEVEKFYATFSKDFYHTEDMKSLANEFLKELKEKKAGRDEFISRFKDICYSETTIPLIHYIFDRLNNFNLASGQRVDLYNPEKNLLKRDFNVEHIMPQKQSGTEKNSEMKDNIGNLLVISRHSNSAFGNSDPSIKLELLKSPIHSGSLRYLHDFVSEYSAQMSNWNDDAIEDRATKLAEVSFDKIWNF